MTLRRIAAASRHRARPRRVQLEPDGDAGRLSHAGELSLDGERPEDRVGRDRQLVHGRLEPGVLHPRLADDLGGAERADHSDQRDERLEVRGGPVREPGRQRMAVAHVGADVRRDRPSQPAHQAHSRPARGFPGSEGSLPRRSEVSSRAQPLQRGARVGRRTPDAGADHGLCCRGRREAIAAGRGVRVHRGGSRGRREAAAGEVARLPTPDDGRPTRGAARTMLADVYANMSGSIIKQNKWAQAAAAAKAVIDSKAYTLVPNFADLWLVNNKNGPEHIYSIQFQGLIRNLFTSQSRPSGHRRGERHQLLVHDAGIHGHFPGHRRAEEAPTFLTQVTVGTTTFYYDDGRHGERVRRQVVRGSRSRCHTTASSTTTAAQSIALNSGRSEPELAGLPVCRNATAHAEAENEASGPANAYAVDQRWCGRAPECPHWQG